jgi:FkbM family methyltransferase
MASNSLVRRAVKRLLSHSVSERYYMYVQSIVMAWDIRTGALSEPEVDVIPVAVRKGDTVLDIGANYGLYSYYLSRAVGSIGRVYAFEPVPFTHSTLRVVRRLLGLKNVQVIPKGCSDRNDTIAFVLPKQDVGPISAGLAHVATRNEDTNGGEARVTGAAEHIWCDVVALDEFLPPIQELSFIKCDIEGAELFAFRGGERTIAQHHPTVLCEINRRFLQGFNIRVEELTSFFLSHGYTLFKYDAGARQLVRIDTLKNLADDNYLFIHGCRSQRFAGLLSREYSRIRLPVTSASGM